MDAPGNRSVLDLFTQLVDNMSLLFRKEVELAKTEMSRNASRVGAGLTTAAIGAVLVIPALVLLLQSAVVWLEAYDVPARWGALIVGIVVAVIGLLMITSGMRAARAVPLAPRRTTTQLQRDAAVVREQVR
jgi:hypothetical protein